MYRCKKFYFEFWKFSCLIKEKIITEYGSRKIQSDKHGGSCLGFTKQSWVCLRTDKPGLTMRWDIKKR